MTVEEVVAFVSSAMEDYGIDFSDAILLASNNSGEDAVT